ncbi:MAG: M20/M25/M40 family metallo-hydrolase [Dehalococcoidia bacterium]|nr:M20/M25/M40 family metallo-hydrolase [Dehalococcoidia bacterium]MDW8119773.1 M20/M25/M40 family metallo-hydrolase [Chloroflexota bacterium]
MDERVRSYILAHMDQALADLERLCNQPSVSAQRMGVEECAQVVKAMLEEAGFTVRLFPLPGVAPVVYAEQKGRSARTVLIYDHYDVQPPEPLELWDSPPFRLTVRDGKAYARGVSDDKGCFVARLQAVKAWRAVYGTVPCTVRWVLEGAEEIGSPHFGDWVAQHADLLRAEGCIWEGGGVTWEGAPTVTLGLKGIAYVELVARGANRDVHSSYGAVVPNPAWRLVWALSTLKGPGERVRIRGFYDRVRPPTRLEREALRRLPEEDAQLAQSLGIKKFVKGVRGYAYRRRLYFEPSCSICGIVGGYTGPGTKTIVPAEARAKVDFRLVPDQRPEEVVALLREHLRVHGFGDIEVIEHPGGSAPARTPLDSPWVRLVADAAQEVYGTPAVLVPTMAGSGPMCFFTERGLPVAMAAGAGYPDNRIHAPNENIRLQDYQRAILHMASIVEALGR